MRTERHLESNTIQEEGHRRELILKKMKMNVEIKRMVSHKIFIISCSFSLFLALKPGEDQDRLSITGSETDLQIQSSKGFFNTILQPYRERGRTISQMSSNETLAERRQALLLKKALCNCSASMSGNQGVTSSSESLSTRNKCVHIHDPIPLLRNNSQCSTLDDTRCVITTHQKPLHIFSIIPFSRKGTFGNFINRSNIKLDARASGGRRRHRESTSRPMSATGENQPFDPFYMLLGMRRGDPALEVSYGFLLVPSGSTVGMGSKVGRILNCLTNLIKINFSDILVIILIL